MTDEEESSLLGRRRGDSTSSQPSVPSFLPSFVPARLFRRKTLAGITAQRKRDGARPLERSLSFASLLLLGVGSVIGAGIFSILGQAVRAAGPAVVVSMLLVGVAALLIALQYAELSSAYPIAGSAYTFCFISFGEMAAFVVAWGLAIEYTVAAAVVARAWSHYLAGVLASVGVTLPDAAYQLRAGPFEVNAAAAALVVLVALLLSGGLSRSVNFNSAAVVLNVTALLFFVAFSLSRFEAKNMSPFWPGGESGTFQAAALLFFAFLGFDSLTLLSEEARRPADVPRALVATLVVCTALYTLVAGALVGSTASAAVDGSSPLSAALADTPWAQGVVAGAATVSLVAAMYASLLSQSRLWFAVSADGLIPRAFSREPGRGGVPASAVWLGAAPAAGAALLFPIGSLSGITSLGACTAFVMVCGVVLHRRYARHVARGDPSVAWRVLVLLATSAALSGALYSDAHPVVVLALGAAAALLGVLPFFFLHARSEEEEDARDDAAAAGEYETPLMPLTSVLGILFVVHIMLGQGAAALGAFGVWQALGVAVYFFYSVKQ